MASNTRIYLTEVSGKQYLVDTTSMGAARTAVAKKHISVRLAKPSEIVQMMRDKSAEILVPGADPGQTDLDTPPNP